MLSALIRFCLENKLVAWLLLFLLILWGLVTAPFDFGISWLPRDPVAVDAIPNIGENQQIVYTEWMGRSPQDMEDQITYPLTTALLGVPGVKSIRSNSMFGFSSIYIIFEDKIDFYWSRSRILEKLNALPPNTLPAGVQPSLGPDATALGQIFWYTLEGRDEDNEPTGGWDLHELRSIQDYYVRYGLSSARGVAEVASIGGFVKEYQIDVDPEALRAYQISLEQVMQAVKSSNLDIGAQTIEINLAEYFVRGLGYIKQVEDLEQSVIQSKNNVPIRISDVAKVQLGPATRRGVLDKSGAEAVGGVVVARYGSNPMEVIQNVKAKIAELAPGLPSKVLPDGTHSQIQVVPFYDRTQLIQETLGTLQEALQLEILITIVVILLMLLNIRMSLLVAGTLPVAVLMCFIAMKYFQVEANIVALSGIAIAIGTMVDMGIVLTESIWNRIKDVAPGESLFTAIFEATTEVASAVLTAVTTTIISFLPVFTMEAAEGKLFRPLAFTKTFALLATIILAIAIIPPLVHSIYSINIKSKLLRYGINSMVVIFGGALWAFGRPALGLILILVGLFGLLHSIIQNRFGERGKNRLIWIVNVSYAIIISWLLALVWMPLGVSQSLLQNFLFLAFMIGGLVTCFFIIIHFYTSILQFLLRFKLLFLLLVGLILYQGYISYSRLGREFMPALDEGAFLLMPTTMPHAGMQANLKNLQLLDMAVTAIPEVETVVGKAGRVNSALDPAPMSMYENVILYKSEYRTDQNGKRLRFRYADGSFAQTAEGDLIPDPNGQYYRQWRPNIKTPDDIWNEIVRVTKLPGVTSAPKLQPIETRLVMLQTGMRAPMGIKISGSDLQTIESFGIDLERILKGVKGVKVSSIFADRIIGKPYLLVDIDRQKISRYGLSIETVQRYIQTAVGGMEMTTVFEGRERYGVRIRYPKELRNTPEKLKNIYLSNAQNQQIPLNELVEIRYEQGAQSIKSEDGFLIGYVLFDRANAFSEVTVIQNAQRAIQEAIESGRLTVPSGISYKFAGNYEQQVRANKKLSVLIPLALVLILLVLYFQFRSVTIAFMVFTGVFIAFAGGFILIGLYNTPWFLDLEIFDTNLRGLFHIQPIHLSVAVWVGFLALFGIATDDGVLVATFLQNSFKKNKPNSIAEIREAVLLGGQRRVRPAMMTTATTLLALLPILTSTGRGADILLPMAIPSFGGMTLQIITMFTVPVLYALWQEWKYLIKNKLMENRQIFTSISILLFLSTAAQAQSLDTLLNIARNNNLEQKALEKEYLVALKRVLQVNQLADPEIGLGVFPLPVETRLGAQLARLSINQMFPWFGTLKQRESLEIAKAQTQYEQIGIKFLEISFNIKKAFLQLYELEKSQAIFKHHLATLNILEQLAQSEVANGQASLTAVLKIQLKIEEYEHEVKILQAATGKPRATLNQLLNRPIETPINIVDSLELASIAYDKENLLEQLKHNHPGMRSYQFQQEVARQTINLNQLNGKLSFGLGLDYIPVTPRNDAFPNGNGRDIVQLRALVKVPLNRTKYRAKEQAEQLKIEALDDKMNDLQNRFEAIMESAFADHEVAQLQINLYNKQIETTQAILNVLMSNYQTQGEGFNELLKQENELKNYELKKIKAVVQSHMAKSTIEKLLNNPVKSPGR